VSAGYMTVDLYVILVVISVVRKFEGDESELSDDARPLNTRRRSPDPPS
jgi:hypothetical protein